MENTLKKLTDLRGISGFEYTISDKITEFFLPYCDEIKKDALGNIIVLKKGKNQNKTIMLEAHMDEIGLMVSETDQNGFIHFINIGGIDERILPSSEVIIHGKKDIKGVIGAKPPHLQSPGEQDKAVSIKDMAIDTGLSPKEVKDLISIGDPVSLSQSVGKMLGNSISLKTLDDRAGVYVLCEVLKNIPSPDINIVCAISVQEEVGMRGAYVSSYSIAPDLAIAIDVCHAVTPDNSKYAFEAGSGTVITVGPNIHPAIGKKLISIAQKHNIKYNIDADPGNTGTDAWAIQTSGYGVPTGLLSIPIKYMHTSVETADLSDISETVSLLVHFIGETGSFKEDWLCF